MFETREPDFINEEGTKWWKDDIITEYAQREDINGTSLNVVCFVIELKDGYKSRVLINDKQEIIEEDQKVEVMGVKIDIRKFLKE